MDDAIALHNSDIVDAKSLSSDDRLVALWLHGRPKLTVEGYGRDAARLRRFVAKPIAEITLADLQAYDDSLADLALRTRARALAAAKSLLRFLHRAGLIPIDVGVVMRTPRIPSDLTDRILTRAEMKRLLRAPRRPRDVALLRIAYETGFRRAELCSLRWSSVTLDEETGEAMLSVIGKGGKPRTLRITAAGWNLAAALRRPEDLDDGPIFRGHDGRPLSASQIRYVVAAAAKRAKIGKPVSPHWFRHAKVSHALDRGAPIHLVQMESGHASMATTGAYAHVRPKDSAAKYLGL
jgi:integrase/recombinase XerD